MKVRFAPSPTGYLHIGNARTALINFIAASKENSEYILRIEDTDRERSTRESEESIINDLQWLGIKWNEGPDIGGPGGPYRQSERYDTYRGYADTLISEGKAYYCYCSQDELDEERKKAETEKRPIVYSGRCRNLDNTARKKFEQEGRKPTIRFHVPDGKTITVKDMIKGDVVFTSENIGGDFIIFRSDGNPIFNFIVIIDDALMGVTHVIRGEDHLSNSPKQILVAEALGLPVPVYAHHSLILGPDRSKLSKRHGITSVAVYRDEGYLAEALVNYLALLGWAAENDEEILSLDEIIRQFDLPAIGKSAPVFDFQKLRWMNSIYIREKPLDEVIELMSPYLKKAGYDTASIAPEKIKKAVSILRGYCELLSDIGPLAGIILDEICEPDEDAATLLKDPDSQPLIKAAADIIKNLDPNSFKDKLIPAIKEETGLKGKKLFHPARAMLTGRLNGPELDLILDAIGYESCKKRIDFCAEKFTI